MYLEATPVVIWHGLDDNCCKPESMGRFKKLVEDNTNAYVISLMIGDSPSEDQINTFLKPVNEQVGLFSISLKCLLQHEDYK